MPVLLSQQQKHTGCAEVLSNRPSVRIREHHGALPVYVRTRWSHAVKEPGFDCLKLCAYSA